METTNSLSLRERKKLQTHIDLAEVALDLFDQHGYANVTVEEIANAVGVSPRTFFRYYPSKEDVLFPNEAETEGILRSALIARPMNEPVLVAARNALIDLAGLFEDRADLARKRSSVIATSPALHSRELEQHARWERVVAEAIAERLDLDPTDLAPSVIAATTVAGVRAANTYWLDSENDVHLVDIATSVLDGLDRGLRHFVAEDGGSNRE